MAVYKKYDVVRVSQGVLGVVLKQEGDQVTIKLSDKKTIVRSSRGLRIVRPKIREIAGDPVADIHTLNYKKKITDLYRTQAITLQNAIYSAKDAYGAIWKALDDFAKDTFLKEFLGESLARNHLTTIRDITQKQFQAELRKAYSIDVSKILSDQNLDQVMEKYLHENIELIKTIPKRFHDDLEKDIKLISKGDLNRQKIIEILQRRYQSTDTNATRIARTETAKFTQQLNMERQTRLGITKFMWVTAKDNRVRDQHEAWDGHIFPYNDPPDGYLPGGIYNCRCIAKGQI